MRMHFLILLLFTFAGLLCVAQSPTCPSPFVYMDGGPFIRYYDPSQPLSATNPNTLNIPTFGGGLTLMPNINGGTLSPTFYSTSGGNYWYWDGVNWVNTGHSTGNGAAVNVGGCNGAIYNLVGASGAVYVYNGTANGTLLTTLTGFNGGGPYDLVTDCNCNFYALKTTNPQSLIMYNAAGQPQCTYSLNGMPNTTAGGGFAIIGNTIYVKNNIANPGGFYIGNIVGATINFTSVPGFTASPGDFASCPVCYPPSNLNGVNIIGGQLSCNTTSINIAVTSTLSGLSYIWSGPGIIGSATGSVLAVNQPGVYSATVSAGGCPPVMVTLSTTVLSNTSVVTASISPSGSICIPFGATKQLVASTSTGVNAIAWNGPGLPTIHNQNAITVGTPGTYTLQVTNTANGCVATDIVTIANNPTVSMALSANSICAQPINGSPATLTITPSGATNYTLFTGSNFSTNSPFGPTMPCFPTSLNGNLAAIASATLKGTLGFCADSVTASFSILPNPTLLTSTNLATICPGGNQVLSVSGANSYTWSGSPGLSGTSGSTVLATPIANAIYSVIGRNGGCFSLIQTIAVNILPTPTVNISPASSTICLGSQTTLIAASDATSFTWTPITGISSSISPVINVSPPFSQTYTLTVSLNTCTNSATAVVNIVQPPNLSLSVPTRTFCASNFNGSPNSVTVAPSGANSYTLLVPPELSVGMPNGPIMQLMATAPLPTVPVVATTTLIGVTSVCTVVRTRTVMIVPNPTISLTPQNSQICPGKSQAYVASGASQYTWLPNTNFSITSPNSIVAFPLYTNFYSVYGSSSGCASTNKNAVLMVLPIPQVSVAARNNTVCIGDSVALYSGGTASSYTWFPSTGLATSNSPTVLASPSVSGTYTVIGSLNTCTNMAVTNVSVITIPVISASATHYTVCKGTTTSMQAEGAISYQWFPTNSLNYPSGDIVIAAPNENTTYTVRGYNGICTGSTSIDIVTLSSPIMSLTASQNAVCKGDPMYMFVEGAQNYTWAPMGSLFFNGSDTMAKAYPMETTNYTVVGANTIGTVSCEQQLSYLVMVVPQVTALASANVTLCAGEKATISASGGNTFKWIPADGLNATDVSRVVASPSISTIYTVDVSFNTYCGSTTTLQVNVNPKPFVNAGRDTSYNLNEVMLIHSTGTGTLTWISGEGIVCADCHETQVYPGKNTCYVAEAVNYEGCKAYDEVCIEVREDFSVYIPNSFTPNNDGINDYFLIYGEGIYDVTIDIYDRWGLRVFRSFKVTEGWDGRYKGGPPKIDTYTYVVTYYGLDRKLYRRSGHVNVLK